MRAALVAVFATFVIGGCGLNLAETPPPGLPATPLASLTPAIAGVRGALDAALRAGAGVGLDDASEGYRPAEPPALTYAPRGVFVVRLPNDPNRLHVVVYSFRDEETALGAGREAAAFYSGGPARVQFPADSQFAVSQLGEVLVFAAWSPGSTTDRATAEAAFAVIRAFGRPIPVSP